MTLLTLFSRLEDPRCGPAKRYDLSEVVGMAHCADDWVAVEDSCEDDEAWRKTFLPLTNGTPSHDTFGNVFRVLDPAVVESCFREWICGRVGVVRDIIALDSFAKTPAVRDTDKDARNLAVLRKIVLTLFQQDALFVDRSLRRRRVLANRKPTYREELLGLRLKTGKLYDSKRKKSAK